MFRILIIGATGVLGSAASRYLLENDFYVTAFVRNRAKALDLEKAGANIIVGDLTNSDSITRACNGVDVIITAAHGMMSIGKNKSKNVDDVGHQNLIKAAVTAKVKHFIYTSLNGASKFHPVDFYRTKFKIEQCLIHSGLCYTILALPAFMEWHVHNLLGKSILQKSKAIILGSGKNPTNFISVQDIVRVLKVIANNEAYFNKTITIGGPENLSRNEIVALYGRLLHIKPRVTHIPDLLLNFLSKLIQPFHPGIGRIIKLSVYSEKSNAIMDPADSIQQFGLQPTTVEEFVKKQLA
ncbi:MAG: SDR family oxidoreductase [Chitinophagaceae bacterium]